MRVLRKVPCKTGAFIEDLSLSEEEGIVPDSLETKNLVEILPTNVIMLANTSNS